MVSKPPENGLPKGPSHINDISEIPVQVFGDDMKTAQKPAAHTTTTEHVKKEFKRADDIVYGEESHLQRNIMIGAAVILIAIGIFFIFYARPTASASYTGNSAVKKIPQLVPPGNGINVTAPKLLYNQTQVISEQYVNLFGKIGWDRPSLPSQGITAIGPPKWAIGPFPRSGYVFISYFTNPGYNVWFEALGPTGTSQTPPAQYKNNMMLYVEAGQTYELDLIADPPVPYNSTGNNTVAVHVQIYYTPEANASA